LTVAVIVGFKCCKSKDVKNDIEKGSHKEAGTKNESIKIKDESHGDFGNNDNHHNSCKPAEKLP
jgi:hypothetical protein